MGFTETLFGGLIAVVVVFTLGRLFRLSNYWSAVLGALLPFLAYLAYSAQNWPGGDVLAIHLVVFLATSAVLGVFNSIRTHREKLHWGPKLIIGFFVGLVIFNATLLSIALHGLPPSVARWFMPHQENRRLYTGFPGIIPHDRNILYEEHQQRIAEQRSLGWQVDVQGLETLVSGRDDELVLKAVDAQGQPIVADRVQLGFWRLANSKDDHERVLVASAPGEYRTEVHLDDPGRWVIEVDIQRGKDVYHMQHPIMVRAPQ